MSQKHLMFDLETWGLRPGAALRSVGGVVFTLDKNEPIGPAFYTNIDHRSCLECGLTIDPNTAAFWRDKRDDSARVLAEDPLPLHQAIATFHAWCIEFEVTYVWSASISFDLPLWMAACDATKQHPPWKHFNTRDAQTLFALYGFDKRDMPMRRPGYKTAAENAIFEAQCLKTAMGAGLQTLVKPKPVSDLFG